MNIKLHGRSTRGVEGAKGSRRVRSPLKEVFFYPRPTYGTHLVVEMMSLALIREMTSNAFTDQGPALRQPGSCIAHSEQTVESFVRFLTWQHRWCKYFVKAGHYGILSQTMANVLSTSTHIVHVAEEVTPATIRADGLSGPHIQVEPIENHEGRDQQPSSEADVSIYA